jgi:hypothetical protein
MRARCVVFAVLAGLSPLPAAAVDVTFTGLVVDTCTVVLATPGIMGMSSDGTALGTTEGIGVPATVTILSIGANTVELSAPTLLTHPADYTPGGETLEIAYTGLASHPLFSTTGLSFALGLLPLSELFVDLKVTNPDGFEQGTYTAKTVLTCS